MTNDRLTEEEIAFLASKGYQLHGRNSEGTLYFMQGDTEIGRSRAAWRELIADTKAQRATNLDAIDDALAILCNLIDTGRWSLSESLDAPVFHFEALTEQEYKAIQNVLEDI